MNLQDPDQMQLSGRPYLAMDSLNLVSITTGPARSNPIQLMLPQLMARAISPSPLKSRTGFGPALESGPKANSHSSTARLKRG